MAISAMNALLYTPHVPEPPNVDKDQSIKDVRNRLAPIIEAARYFGRVTYMTNRGVRVAAIVPVEIGELVDEVGDPETLVRLVRSAQRTG